MNTQNIAQKDSDKKESYNGVVIALKVPKVDADKLASGIGEGDYKSVDSEHYHITLAHLGDSQELENLKENTIELLTRFSESEPQPIITYNGVGRFKNIEDDGLQAVYASVNNRGLNDFRSGLTSQLVDHGIDYSDAFGFIPHITLLYIEPESSTPRIELPDDEVQFENISLLWGDEQIDFPLQPLGMKIGKRLAQSQVEKLKEAIGFLLDVIGYVNYEDEVERLIEDVEAENKQAKWTAKVGETIIGNLARGEGGRFVSAANIAKMTNLLDAENISPEMFEAMQALLAGKEISPALMQQLQTAGLATEDGTATTRVSQIIKAMKTGSPDKLKETLKPKGGGGGKGKGKKPKKPPKEQIQAENVDKVGQQLIEQERLTEIQFNALKKFAIGEDVDQTLMQELVDLGIVEVNQEGFFSFTSSGNRMFTALEKDDLRKALDELNKSEANIVEQLERERREEQEKLDEETQVKDEEARVEEMRNEFVNRSGFGDVQAFVDFVNGDEPALDFSGFGLTELDNEGKQITTTLGRRLSRAIEKGNLRDALDVYREAILNVSDVDEKNFDLCCNGNCFGFKVLQGENDTYLLTWTTNAYEDREGEIFTLKSLENYVNENDDKEVKGSYQFWHVPGSEFADIVAQMVTGKFLVEIGRFRKDDIGNAFKQFFLKHPKGHKEIAPNGWGCSHGFVYRKADREDGIYEWFDKKETTILPLHEAANVFTLMELL